MDDINRILVVSRSTEDCKKTFRYGAHLARAFSAQLSILHIEYDPFDRIGFHYLAGLAIFRDEYKARMKSIREELQKCVADERRTGMTITEIVQKGDPVDEIIKAVERDAIDLVLLAAHPEGRLERIIYGRSNHELIRRLPCSMLFVKAEEELVEIADEGEPAAQGEWE
jgi:universal stress protein A